MKISATMLRNHLGQITLTYFVEHSEVPEDLSELDSYIDTMQHDAQAAGDLPWLLLGLRQLVNDPQVDLASYGGGVFPLKAEGMRDIICHVLHRLDAPGGIAPPALPITLESMSGEAWRAHRDAMQPPG